MKFLSLFIAFIAESTAMRAAAREARRRKPPRIRPTDLSALNDHQLRDIGQTRDRRPGPNRHLMW